MPSEPNHSCFGTPTNDATVGTVAWSNPTNVIAQDGLLATALVTNGAVSKYLKALDFGFSGFVPAGATITGIEVQWNRWSGINAITDNSVRLYKSGALAGSDKSAGAIWVAGSTASYVTYGGPGDLWGTTWTAAQVNATDFGVALSGANFDGSMMDDTASIDHVRVTIYYDVATERAGSVTIARRPDQPTDLVFSE